MNRADSKLRCVKEHVLFVEERALESSTSAALGMESGTDREWGMAYGGMPRPHAVTPHMVKVGNLMVRFPILEASKDRVSDLVNLIMGALDSDQVFYAPMRLHCIPISIIL